MRRVFADTYYWIALLNDRDQGHAAARAISQALPQAAIMTTQEVLSIAQRLSWFLGLQVPLPEVCQG
jgi:predicted nucleic acid-binding protein